MSRETEKTTDDANAKWYTKDLEEDRTLTLVLLEKLGERQLCRSSLGSKVGRGAAGSGCLCRGRRM